MSPLPLEPGGFIHLTLPSPTNSSINSRSADPILPQPRSTPLQSGSARESTFINYVDKKLLGISRRYQKKFEASYEDQPAPELEGRGYEEFAELARDVQGLTDVVWVSGTPMLQAPYFLTIALALSSYMCSFPFAPRSMFKLLDKLDLIFLSLLRGTNVQTGEKLPGFEGGRGGLSTTQKVRMRNIIESTRLAVVDAARNDRSVIDTASETDTETEIEIENEYMMDETDDTEARGQSYDEEGYDRWEMKIARVYERTIVELGLSLDSSGIGGFGGP